jgi:hypothetical protein
MITNISIYWFHFGKDGIQQLAHNGIRIFFYVVMNRHSNRHTPRRKCKMRSKFWWLTGFRNSHDVSHFAAFFIVVGAKTSVAESVSFVFCCTVRLRLHAFLQILWWVWIRLGLINTFFGKEKWCQNVVGYKDTHYECHLHCRGQHACLLPLDWRSNRGHCNSWDTGREEDEWDESHFLLLFVLLERCGNDPSAGSPTETLLRLHLPLNDEV